MLSQSMGAKKSAPTKSLGMAEDAKRPKAQTFVLYRMVPPSAEGIQFYYSLQNPKNFKREIFIDNYKKKVFVDDQLRQKYNPRKDDSGSENEDEHVEALKFPKFLNETKPIPLQLRDITAKERLEMRAKPRIAFNTQELTRPKSAWSLAVSFFAKYKFDDDAILAKCFDWDWRCSALDKTVRDPAEKEKLIRYLRPKYGLIREAYKHLACVAPAGNMPSIGMNVLTELMLKCNDFVDYKYTKLSDVDLAFVATNAFGAKKYPFRAEVVINPERQIVRYQFFEILMRLAIERANKMNMPVSEGV